MRLLLLVISIMGASAALKQKLQLQFVDVICFLHPSYGTCNWVLLNNSHFNAFIILKLPLSGLRLRAQIVQVESKNRITRIFNRKYDFCARNEDVFTHFMVVYVGRIIDAFFEGKKVKCPLSAGNYTAHSIAFNNELIPLQLFYKPRSHFISNISLFDFVDGKEKSFADISLKCRIVK